MAETTADTTGETSERSDEEAKLDPRALAKSVVLAVADEPEEVGDFAQSIDLGDNVTDFRFVCHRKGYEGWQWAVTLYHDIELDSWSVNESTLVPTKDSLLAPAWIPWKDRLEAADLSVTDSLGTDPDDPRMEEGFRKTEVVEQDSASVAETGQSDSSVVEQSSDDADSETESEVSVSTQVDESTTPDGEATVSGAAKVDADIDPETGLSRELEDTVEEFGLSRRHVMSELGRSQTAKRWYDGQHGPKSLSTKTADGNLCSTCAFFIGLKGDLDTMFGVCANRWSPDDGRVVSLDHGCGEHSEIQQPEPSHLWVQSKPAFDDLHIDIIAQAPREERSQVELIESIDEDDDVVDTESEESDEVDDTDDETATENDIAEHAVPGSLDDDDDESDEEDETEAIGKGTVGSAVTVDAAVESTIDLSDDDEGDDVANDDSEDDGSDDDSTDNDSDDDAAGADSDGSYDLDNADGFQDSGNAASESEGDSIAEQSAGNA
ncbi:DUF3027 domain-containing protein [Bifidobacterium sp. ESL0732]|uniref:DUF3027 domain-containing protein n=1 Tax=Bifidobacterium sp. ESL0732 TaxID=2983222 RepID=UPI0023F8F1D0|nr:DUF3027 domain-containing protein [Bifidobacterium sp. ESL0732]WEV63392.1 DUF3027 domain-containing protein [Bifidobacterium sp. ESL0732]